MQKEQQHGFFSWKKSKNHQLNFFHGKRQVTRSKWISGFEPKTFKVPHCWKQTVQMCSGVGSVMLRSEIYSLATNKHAYLSLLIWADLTMYWEKFEGNRRKLYLLCTNSKGNIPNTINQRNILYFRTNTNKNECLKNESVHLVVVELGNQSVKRSRDGQKHLWWAKIFSCFAHRLL